MVSIRYATQPTQSKEMAKVRSEILGVVSGTVGDITLANWKGIKVARRRRGPSTLPPSEAQAKQRENFAIASEYAKEIGADPTKRQIYTEIAKGQPTTWRALAVQDYLTPPILSRVDVRDYNGKAGDRIDIYVHDVTCDRVSVTLLDSTAPPPEGEGEDWLGAVVEEGEALRAVEGQDYHWIYRATVSLPVEKFRLVVTARDLPGNEVTETVEGEV